MPLSNYLPHEMGKADVQPKGAFEAGSFASFTLTYTAGKFGIDDTGSLKVVHRFASDMGRPTIRQPICRKFCLDRSLERGCPGCSIRQKDECASMG